MKAYYPEPLELDAYGNGGFRFGEMSHRGSLLILNSGIYGWELNSFEKAQPADFELLFDEAVADDGGHEFLIFGTGESQQFMTGELKQYFADKGLWVEVMDTGAAARTFNVLHGEGRKVAAALIAV